MKRGLRLLCVGGLAASIAADGINAEVHRLAISEIAASMVEAQEAAEGELGRVSFSARQIAARLPDLARVVATNSDAGPATVTAVFAVKSGATVVGEWIEVEMERLDDGTYGVSRRSVDRFRAWLGARFIELMRGNLALERVEGLPGPLAFQLANAAGLAGTVSTDGMVDRLDRLEPRLAGFQEQMGQSFAKVGFVDMEGGTRLLSDFRGRVVLLHVWATWCTPCIAAMPALEALEGRYRDQGLTVVNLSDEPADVIEDWLLANPTDMVHGRVDDFAFLAANENDEEEQGMLRVRPVYVILDRQGDARAHRVGGGRIQLKIVQGPDGETRSTTTDTHYLSDWVRPHL